mgnify:CR=1 FL=1
MDYIINITGYIGIVILAILCYVVVPGLFFFLLYKGLIGPVISLFRKNKGKSSSTPKPHQ